MWHWKQASALLILWTEFQSLRSFNRKGLNGSFLHKNSQSWLQISDLHSSRAKRSSVVLSRPLSLSQLHQISVRQAFGENQTQPLANDSTEQRTTTVLCGNYIPFLGVNRNISFKHLHNVLFKAHIHHWGGPCWRALNLLAPISWRSSKNFGSLKWIFRCQSDWVVKKK